MAKLILQRDQLTTLCEHADPPITTDTELAERIGMHQTQVSRILHGNKPFGEKFIAGLCDVFGVEAFAVLFTVQSERA